MKMCIRDRDSCAVDRINEKISYLYRPLHPGVLRLIAMTAKAANENGIEAVSYTHLNDIGCSDYTIGFDTACNTAIECIDKLRDTMQSHERCSVVEVMGRRAGHLALQVGCAVGATAICLPERQLDFDTEIVERMRIGRIKGRNHHIIIVAAVS